jgi:2-C-methyl-D-erythritol 4-phosphate cytidylyltransferase/2-C-methyl-D-erythritol 2,4-cyclodiphosphate synthase
VIVAEGISAIAHSDGDVVSHALVDAILGAAGLGDIGEMFANTDERWKDVSSIIFLDEALKQIRSIGFSIVNADVTIAAEKPKLLTFKPRMRQILEGKLGASVNIKAGTNEGCDAVGRAEAIAATAVVLLAKS